MQTISKSQFKPQALAYLRLVEKTKQPLVITHGGRPVVQLEPYRGRQRSARRALRHTVISYKDPTAPVGEGDWTAL